jgi:hypothetical protein
VATVVGVLVALLLVAEALALPVATRLIGRVLDRCVTTETFAVTAVERPAVPRLLLGRARDVELAATGVHLGRLRIDGAELALPEAYLPWAVRVPPTPPEAELRLSIGEDDLERAVRDLIPLGLPVTVSLEPGVARLGAPGTPVTVDLAVAAGGDGGLRVRPVAGDTQLWERLGVEAALRPVDGAEVREVTIGDGVLTGEVALAAVPGVGDGRGCDRPLAGAGRSAVDSSPHDDRRTR